MTDADFQDAVDLIVLAGRAPIATERNVETATNMYPGRHVKGGSTVYDVVVGTWNNKPKGWLGFEQSALNWRPDNIDTAYAASAKAKVLRGGGFVIRAKLAPYMTVARDDLLGNWGVAGCLAGPVLSAPGGVFLGIPFTKNTSETDTNIDIPSGMIVSPLSFVQVIDAVAAATINVGILSSESGGDADGFIKAASCAAAGIVGGSLMAADASTGGETLGALLQAGAPTELKDANTKYGVLPKLPGWIGDGTATSVSYTTSNHAIAGKIWLHLLHPGLTIMGKAEEAVTTTTTADDIDLLSYI